MLGQELFSRSTKASVPSQGVPKVPQKTIQETAYWTKELTVTIGVGVAGSKLPEELFQIAHDLVISYVVIRSAIRYFTQSNTKEKNCTIY